jgi:hypothetical protein
VEALTVAWLSANRRADRPSIRAMSVVPEGHWGKNRPAPACWFTARRERIVTSRLKLQAACPMSVSQVGAKNLAVTALGS